MPSYDASSARCSVIAYKEGLLSAVGHNVRLQVDRFEVRIDDDGVEAEFEAASLRAICAVKDGHDDHGALSDKDKDTIAGYVRKDILETGRHPRIIFRSTEFDRDEDEIAIEGELELHGETRDIELVAAREGSEWVARVRIRQPDFGIRPFKALMGALKIKPEVDVELRIPAEG
jgi:hypothetical protein